MGRQPCTGRHGKAGTDVRCHWPRKSGTTEEHYNDYTMMDISVWISIDSFGRRLLRSNYEIRSYNYIVRFNQILPQVYIVYIGVPR